MVKFFFAECVDTPQFRLKLTKAIRHTKRTPTCIRTVGFYNGYNVFSVRYELRTENK